MDAPQLKTVVALVSDLIFGSKITGVAAAVGVPVDVVREPAAVLVAAGVDRPVLIDLTLPVAVTGPLIAALKQADARRMVLGFYPHVDEQLAVAARAAGADVTLARGAFTRRLPEILRDLSASIRTATTSPQQPLQA